MSAARIISHMPMMSVKKTSIAVGTLLLPIVMALTNAHAAPISLQHATLTTDEIHTLNAKDGTAAKAQESTAQPTGSSASAQVLLPPVSAADSKVPMINASPGSKIPAQDMDQEDEDESDLGHSYDQNSNQQSSNPVTDGMPQEQPGDTTDMADPQRIIDDGMQPSAVGNQQLDPAIIASWTEKVELLERENIALRDRLKLGETDKLNDIRVDAVTRIHENVLRERVAELEKELDKMHFQQGADSESSSGDDLASAVKGAIPAPPKPGSMSRNHP